MAVDKRQKNANWTVAADDGHVVFDGAQLAVLMDIRDELQGIGGTLGRLEDLARCSNVARGFIAMNKVRLHLEKFGVKPKPKKPAK